MIVVHGFAPLEGLASPSPFCLKLETWLRMAQIPYRARADFNPLTAPKGKAPWVTLEDGTQLSDSSHIIQTLSARDGVTVDEGLTADDRHRALVVQRLVEDHLYFAVLYTRWVQDDGFAILRRTYFRHLPWPAREAVPLMARRSVVKTAWFQGTGRHRPEEVHAAAADDLAALSWLLGDRRFFLGERLRSVDATVWATLANIHWGGFPGPVTEAMRSHANLVAYCERVREAVWAEEPAGGAVASGAVQG